MLGKLKKVSFKNIYGVLLFLIVLIPSLVYHLYLKLIKKELWLICENKNMARDNGFTFFKYVVNHHSEIKTYYAIDKKCNDYQKLKDYKNVVNFSGIKHYFLYLASTKNISSHKEGNPNHALFTFLHLYLNLFCKNVFLQHGVLYQDFSMFHKKNTKFKLFICGAKKEYDYVKKHFGYKDEVVYTGLARFDNLIDVKRNTKTIVFMPTWRRWIESEEELLNSEYYTKINELLNSLELEKLLDKYDYHILFFPHISFSRFNHLFKTDSERIKILRTEDVDISKLFQDASLLITDYSSIHTDFAFMKKPIIYYQHDKIEFREKHYDKDFKTYFDYDKDGFGYVCYDLKQVLNSLKEILKKDCVIDELFESRIDEFFVLHDNLNCQRIYEEIIRR